MSHSILKMNQLPTTIKPPRPPSREDYFRHRPAELHGRLGYGGQKPRLIGCEILQLSDAGAFVEPYVRIDDIPELFTLEINGQYHRARLCYAEGSKLRLEFFNEELDYVIEG
jgi:hypothetical protein